MFLFSFFYYNFLQRFIDTVNDCRLLIVPVEGAAPVGKRTTRTSSFVSKARKQVHSPLNRRTRLKEAAQKTDQKRIEREKVSKALVA